jgi:hypothetical protein
MRGEHHHEHGRYQGYGKESRGPALFYGYCSESGTMRMMDYPEYVSNMQTAYSNMYKNMTSTMQSYMENLRGWAGRQYGHKPGCDCCDDNHGKGHGCHEHDCHCSCCIKCADAVEYARCGEIRLIPITLENDSRREREVRLELGGFSTSGGQNLEWQAALSETQFKLPPCGEKTVLLRVAVDCAKFGTQGTPSPNEPGTTVPPRDRQATVDECKVAYATLRADGCMIRPLVIAVAVLPNDCGAHHAGCQCGCCC